MPDSANDFAPYIEKVQAELVDYLVHSIPGLRIAPRSKLHRIVNQAMLHSFARGIGFALQREIGQYPLGVVKKRKED